MLAALAALLTGAILRQRQTHLQRGWWVALVLGAIGVFIDQDYFRLPARWETSARFVGALLLLRPVTPQRGMRSLALHAGAAGQRDLEAIPRSGRLLSSSMSLSFCCWPSRFTDR